MARQRKTYTAEFMALVALAAVKGDKTVNELVTQFEAQPTLIKDEEIYLERSEAVPALRQGPAWQPYHKAGRGGRATGLGSTQ